MNTERLKKFVALENRKAEISLELKQIAAEQERIGEGILEDLLSAEIDNIKTGGRTIFIKKDVFAQIKGGKEAAIGVLKKAGLTDFVSENYNTNTISSFVRECIKNDESLPKEFGNVITAGERVRVASVKS